MKPTSTAERPNWHMGHLDALRGLAVFGVVLVHTALESGLPERWTLLARVGQRGVQLFFLISGFTLFLSNDQRRRSEAHPTRNFFLRRLFRLTPMYYLAIALAALLDPPVIGTPYGLLLGLVYLQWLSPEALVHVAPGAWTISVEAMFYLCLPLLFRYVRSWMQAVAVTAVVGALMAGMSFLLARTQPQNYQYYSFLWFPVELPVFLMGITVYLLWKRFLAHRAVAPPRFWSLALYVLAAVVLALSFPEKNRTLYLSSAGCALLLAAVSIDPWPILVNRVTIFLGRVSYSIYLLHVFILLPLLTQAHRMPYLRAHPQVRFGVLLTATMALTTAAASVTWLYVEETGIRLGRRLIAHLEHRAVLRAATDLPAPAAELAQVGNSADAQF